MPQDIRFLVSEPRQGLPITWDPVSQQQSLMTPNPYVYVADGGSGLQVISPPPNKKINASTKYRGQGRHGSAFFNSLAISLMGFVEPAELPGGSERGLACLQGDLPVSCSGHWACSAERRTGRIMVKSRQNNRLRNEDLNRVRVLDL